MAKLVVVVDDEADILELVALHLERAGFRVKGFPDAEKFLAFVDKKTPDLIILDLMLPDMDGLEICKTLRNDKELHSVPLIMLTAKAEETDKILGLELGADDYVTKPFSPKELLARVKALLRRQEQKSKSETITVGGVLEIDTKKFQITVEGKKIDVTTTEFKILELLASKEGWVFTRDKILDYLWGTEKAVLDRTIDVHIRNLREKLGKAKKFVKNVRGVGYKLEE
jgi:DNA-binding response OmpR family regulator